MPARAPRAALIARPLRAFTLIELLVVVAIIALLVAILIPTLRRAKQQAQSAVCKSNLHSLANCAALYEGEYGILMPVSDNSTGQGWASPDKVGYIYPYLNNPVQLDVNRRNKIWICPSMEHDLTSVSQQEDYGMNSYPITSSTDPRLKLVDIKNPALTMQWADSGSIRTTSSSLYLTVINGSINYPSIDLLFMKSNSTGQFNARHAGTKGNVSWYDGHVEEQPATIPTDLATTDLMNKWHCGTLTPMTGSVTSAQIQSNHAKNAYFFADADSGRLVQVPKTNGNW